MSGGTGSGNPSVPLDPEDKAREKCLFCRIIDEKSQDLTSLTYKDDEVVAFPDIRPAAKYHYLISPREHIKDAKSLTPAHISLVERLVEVGNKVVNEKIQADAAAGGTQVNVDQVPKLMGFHWPPFHSIAHLHLHVIAPSDSMGFISRTIFRPNSWWFVTPEYVKERLSKDVILPVDSKSTSNPSDSPSC
jgi:diadenosine tetraphosphate (Ap4A) HIT family hydrolase